MFREREKAGSFDTLYKLFCRVQHICFMLISIPIEHKKTILHTAVFRDEATFVT